MIRSVLLLLCLAAAGFAEHEDVVDTILASISGKFTKTAVPFYVSSMHQYIKSFNIKVTLSLRNGKMSLVKLARNGDVTYTSPSDNEAIFKFKAALETSIVYDYSFASTSSQISSGSAVADWKSEVDMEITASSDGCQLKIADARNTRNFQLHFEPVDLGLFPVTVHYPVGDVVETNVIPSLDKALNKTFSGWNICDIFTC